MRLAQPQAPTSALLALRCGRSSLFPANSQQAVSTAAAVAAINATWGAGPLPPVSPAQQPGWRQLTRSCAAAAAAASSSQHQQQRTPASGRPLAWLAAAGGALVAALVLPGPASADAPRPAPPGSAAALAEAAAADGVKAGGKLLSLPMRQRIFFKYEKRIRDLSTLEKIFDYFATHQSSEGHKAMASQDVVRALVPTYPPVGSDVERAGFLDGERGHGADVTSARDQILSFFDTDKNGTIGFNEFVLIVIALSVPEKDVEVVFDVMDLDNNGVIDPAEFHLVLEQLERRAGLQQAFHGRAGSKHSLDNDRQLTSKLFLDRGGGVSLSRFRQFLRRLQDGMLRLEFAHYDTQGSGSISGADFANSLITAADIRRVDAYLDKVDSLPPALANARIKLADFKTMAQLRRGMHMLSFALDFCHQIERPLCRDEFSKLVSKALGLRLGPPLLDILFALFPAADGGLDGPAFVDIMKRRNRIPGYKKGQGLIAAEDDDHTPVVAWFNCVRSCTFGFEPQHSSPAPPK